MTRHGRTRAVALMAALGLMLALVACDSTTSTEGTTAASAGSRSGQSTASSGSGQGGSDEAAQRDPDDDSDQDGVPAADDNCDGVFNPEQSDKACDGTKDEFDGQNPCGATHELRQVTDNGDERTLTVVSYCLEVGDDPPLGGLGTVILEDGEKMFIDVTDEELDTLRGRGVRIEPVDTVGAVTPEQLIEARIELDPNHALETADTDHLAEVDPNVLLTVPDDAIAELPDDALAALPTDFWTKAPTSTIEEVGKDRIVRVNPDATIVRLPAKAIGDVKADGAVATDSTTTSTTASSRTTSSSTTASSTTTTSGRG